MTVAARCTTSPDVINGLGTIMTGAGTPQYKDSHSGDPNWHFVSGENLPLITNLDTRYRNKPGPNGSGNWELYT